MAQTIELDASRVNYDELIGRYIFRKQMKMAKYDTTQLHKAGENKQGFIFTGKSWKSYPELFYEVSGLVGDPYEFIVLTRDQAIEIAKEKWGRVDEELFD